MTKERVLDVLSTCRCRHEYDSNCKDCVFYGKDCCEAHDYAFDAVQCLTVKEVKSGVSKQQTGSRLFRDLY